MTAIGDRVSLGITTVLTGIFLVGFSSQDMPKASYMKAAELYIVVSFGFTFMALLESALAYKLSAITSKERKEVKNKGAKENDKVYTLVMKFLAFFKVRGKCKVSNNLGYDRAGTCKGTMKIMAGHINLANTGEPLLCGHLLNGHPLLGGQQSKSH